MLRRPPRLGLPHPSIACLAATLLLAACAPQQEAADPDAREAEIRAKLVAADKADGSEDHVISRCAGCALHMDGKDDQVVMVRGYEMHLCSATCKANAEEAPDKMILALEPDEGLEEGSES